MKIVCAVLLRIQEKNKMKIAAMSSSRKLHTLINIFFLKKNECFSQLENRAIQKGRTSVTSSAGSTQKLHTLDNFFLKK